MCGADCDAPPCQGNKLSNRTLHPGKRQEPNNAGMFLNTHDGNDPTDPQRLSAPGSTHYPDPITEVPLNDDRSDCSHDGNVYRGKMGVREAFYVAKSSNKPIVDIGPSERGLNGLQDENEIRCSEFNPTSQG